MPRQPEQTAADSLRRLSDIEKGSIVATVLTKLAQQELDATLRSIRYDALAGGSGLRRPTELRLEIQPSAGAESGDDWISKLQHISDEEKANRLAVEFSKRTREVHEARIVGMSYPKPGIRQPSLQMTLQLAIPLES